MRREFGEFGRYFDAALEVLMAGRQLRGRARALTRAGIGHAIAFSTWRSLVREQGLRQADAVEFMCRAVAATAQPRATAPRR